MARPSLRSVCLSVASWRLSCRRALPTRRSARACTTRRSYLPLFASLAAVSPPAPIAQPILAAALDSRGKHGLCSMARARRALIQFGFARDRSLADPRRPGASQRPLLVIVSGRIFLRWKNSPPSDREVNTRARIGTD